MEKHYILYTSFEDKDKLKKLGCVGVQKKNYGIVLIQT